MGFRLLPELLFELRRCDSTGDLTEPAAAADLGVLAKREAF